MTYFGDGGGGHSNENCWRENVMTSMAVRNGEESCFVVEGVAKNQTDDNGRPDQ